MSALLPDPVAWVVIGVTGAALLFLLAAAVLILAVLIEEALR